MKESWVAIVCIAGFLLLTALYPAAGWMVRETLFANPGSDAPREELERRIQALEAELARRTVLSPQNFASGAPSGTAAFVFSRYPFNFKHEVLVSAGRDRGIQAGDAAIVPVVASSPEEGVTGVLLGKVTEVFSRSALVQTVFDADFESAVRIGANGTDALLKGGGTPRVTLIPKRAEVNEGDIVYTASPAISYGIAVGALRAVELSVDNVFEEATLDFGYDINRVMAVTILPAIKRQ